QYAHRDHLCIPCSKIEQGIQSRGSKFDENYSLRWVSSAWTSTRDAFATQGDGGAIRCAVENRHDGGGDGMRHAQLQGLM
ncbi:hypothetical protein KDW55_28520, partial [Burkholderia sp. AU19243]|uniref:hypothetical protein n=1 Tax=Burkholderia sp. AU19243 TaxID=2824810 RepID=UPI001B96B69E